MGPEPGSMELMGPGPGRAPPESRGWGSSHLVWKSQLVAVSPPLLFVDGSLPRPFLPGSRMLITPLTGSAWMLSSL